ncbi:hypothetical protein [Hydrogenophaga laconesensis]|uniref:Uncharacterized protein n=1 Tax=Hydrogenophaga laconesensis TaxID=1805971 RepID=A0ABU1V9Q0_9BURK|nr:hypothetical protein [Hydrogenophaga laconesensis]MDR7094155.1 hypothetical protein [Hydrogenophaga laconesensis]
MISYKFDLATMKPVVTMREKVQRLEKSMYSMPQAECPVRHYFANGMYAREITIPKGVTLVGAIHKMENLAILSKGRLELVTDEGTVTLEAPCTVTVKPGAKNAALALEESVWTNFLPNPDNETDTDRLVEVFTHSKASELLGGKDNPQLIAQREREKLEN